MPKALFLLILSSFCLNLFSQKTYFRWEGIILEKNTTKGVANANIRVFSDGRLFLFSADSRGSANISYFRPTEYDSILITSIGYKPRKLSHLELQSLNEMQLEEEVLTLNEMVVTPARRMRTTRLGNTNSSALGSLNQQYESQKVLFIPYSTQIGKILKIRYYMGGLFTNRFSDYKIQNYRPFRVRLYEKDTIKNTIGKDLLNDVLIISQNRNRHWLEVDISEYNITIPQNGVFVGFEILPEEYYIENNIISDTYVDFKGGRSPNSVRFGVSNSNQKNRIEQWSLNHYTKQWSLDYFASGYNYLINIEVEKLDK